MPVICEKVSVDVETEVGYVCNCCKKSVTIQDDPLEAQEFMIFENHCGYGSVFGDGTVIELCLCQDCTKRILGHYFIDKETGKFL